MHMCILDSYYIIANGTLITVSEQEIVAGRPLCMVLHIQCMTGGLIMLAHMLVLNSMFYMYTCMCISMSLSSYNRSPLPCISGDLSSYTSDHLSQCIHPPPMYIWGSLRLLIFISK